MTRQSSRTSNRKSRIIKSRRRFLALAATGSATAIAGCSGDGGSGSTQTEGSGNGNSGQTDTSGGSGTESGSNFDDVSFEFWDSFNVQSRQARTTIERMIGQFEGQTGASVQTNWSSYGELAGAKWVNAFGRGQIPILYTSETADMGKFFINDWVKPVREYEDRLPDGLMENIEWIRPIIEDAARGFDSILYELPFGILPRNPIVARTDHLEAAGFDPDSFKVTGYEDLIQKASKVQQDGPGDYGFQIFGGAYDWNDIMQVWAMAEYGKKGRLFNEDWSDVNYTNEAFMDMAKKYTEVYQKHELSSPNTPQEADEPMVPALNQGTVSMSMPEWLNLPEFLSQAGDKVKDGTIRWYPMWEGDSGQRGMFGMYGIGITRGPPDADQKTVERRQEAAIEFMSMWFSKEFQKKLPHTMGVLPVREDVYDELEIPGANKNKIVETATTMINSVKYAWEYHPNCSSVRAGIPGNYMSKMLNGSISPEEAMNSMYGEAQSLSHVPYDKSKWKKP